MSWGLSARTPAAGALFIDPDDTPAGGELAACAGRALAAARWGSADSAGRGS